MHKIIVVVNKFDWCRRWNWHWCHSVIILIRRVSKMLIHTSSVIQQKKGVIYAHLNQGGKFDKHVLRAVRMSVVLIPIVLRQWTVKLAWKKIRLDALNLHQKSLMYEQHHCDRRSSFYYCFFNKKERKIKVAVVWKEKFSSFSIVYLIIYLIYTINVLGKSCQVD